MYGNEAEVGRAIEASGIPREELFVTSKLDNGNHRPEAAAASIARSLEDLRLASLDLFLVHWPLPTLYDGDGALPWPALEDAYRAGECLAIGLSNYETAHMRAVMDRAAVKPHAIQVESHPYMPNSTILRFAQRHRMVFEAWSPLARGRAARDPLLASIGHPARPRRLPQIGAPRPHGRQLRRLRIRTGARGHGRDQRPQRGREGPHRLPPRHNGQDVTWPVIFPGQTGRSSAWRTARSNSRTC